MVVVTSNNFKGLNQRDKFVNGTQVYSFGHIKDLMLEELDGSALTHYNFNILAPIGKEKLREFSFESIPVHYTLEAGTDPTMAFVLNDEIFYCPRVTKEFWDSKRGELLKEKVNDSKLSFLNESIHKPIMKVAYYLKEVPDEIDFDFLKEVYLNEISLLGEGEGYIYSEFPQRLLNSFDDEWHTYIIHHHLKEGKVHTDIRLNVNDHLEGFLLFTPNELGNEDLLNNAAMGVRGVLKGPQSLDWESFEGITDLNEIFYIVGSGKYRVLKKSNRNLNIEFKSNEGYVNSEVLDLARKKNLNLLSILPHKLKKLDGSFSFSLEEVYPNKYFVFFNKIEKELTKTRVSNEQLQNIYNFTISGMNRPEISKKVGLSTDTVWRYQKKLGL